MMSPERRGFFHPAFAGLMLAALLVGIWVALGRSPDAVPLEVERTAESGQASQDGTSVESPATPERVEVAVTPPRPEASSADADVELPPHPDDVALPTIGGEPPSEQQSAYLRMLAHAMANAGMPWTMPEDIPKDSFDLLNTWTEPMLTERADLTKRCTEIAQRAVKERLDSGAYEVKRTTPTSWPPSEVVGWRWAKDARGKDIVYVVRIRGGELPKVDYMRARSNAIDMDMAAVARGLFDRLVKKGE